MNTSTTSIFSPLAVGLASRHPLRRLLDVFASAAHRLRLRWQHAQWDEATRYLSGAADHADLERRLRALERGSGARPC